MELPENFWIGTGLFGLVAASVYISKRVYEHGNSDPISVAKGAQLIRKSVDHVTIAKETVNPVSCLMYASYARALLDAAQQLAKENELTKASKIRIPELQTNIEETEKYAKEKINANLYNQSSSPQFIGQQQQQSIPIPMPMPINSQMRPPIPSGTIY